MPRCNGTTAIASHHDLIWQFSGSIYRGRPNVDCIERDPDIGVQGGDGRSPLHEEVKGGHLDITQLLLGHGANGNT
jgi:ankyrin repeat protein